MREEMMDSSADRMTWRHATLLIGLGLALFLLFGVMPAQAIVPERPRVELVKVFGCNVRMRTAESCAYDIESRANAWFQEKQPGAHILKRLFHGSEDGVYLVISYEVLEWRTKVQSQKKLPAEAP